MRLPLFPVFVFANASTRGSSFRQTGFPRCNTAYIFTTCSWRACQSPESELSRPHVSGYRVNHVGLVHHVASKSSITWTVWLLAHGHFDDDEESRWKSLGQKANAALSDVASQRFETRQLAASQGWWISCWDQIIRWLKLFLIQRRLSVARFCRRDEFQFCKIFWSS